MDPLRSRRADRQSSVKDIVVPKYPSEIIQPSRETSLNNFTEQLTKLVELVQKVPDLFNKMKDIGITDDNIEIGNKLFKAIMKGIITDDDKEQALELVYNFGSGLLKKEQIKALLSRLSDTQPLVAPFMPAISNVIEKVYGSWKLS